MNYISSAEAAQKWGFSPRWVSKLAKEGRIPNAVKIGASWMLPEDAEKPLDGRTTAGKSEQAQMSGFRYPIFEYREVSAFNPPLSAEELIIKKSSEAFFACRFEEGSRILGKLPETAENRYIRIYALRLGCAGDIFLCNTGRFFARYSSLIAEFEEDFPYKKEMEECLHELDATLGNYEHFTNQFRVVPGYSYHESFLPHLALLNAVSLAFPDSRLTRKELSAHEFSCVWLRREHAWCDLQSMHIYLGSGYAFLKMQKEMTYHFRQALLIAEKYELLYAPAVQYFYLKKPFESALRDFSDDFKRRFTEISIDIHRRYLTFTDKISMNTIYRLLPRDDYILLYWALMGFANKEIARLMHISEGTVGKRYSGMYSILGVKNKQEMLALYRKQGDSVAIK